MSLLLVKLGLTAVLAVGTAMLFQPPKVRSEDDGTNSESGADRSGDGNPGGRDTPRDEGKLDGQETQDDESQDPENQNGSGEGLHAPQSAEIADPPETAEQPATTATTSETSPNEDERISEDGGHRAPRRRRARKLPTIESRPESDVEA